MKKILGLAAALTLASTVTPTAMALGQPAPHRGDAKSGPIVKRGKFGKPLRIHGLRIVVHSDWGDGDPTEGWMYSMDMDVDNVGDQNIDLSGAHEWMRCGPKNEIQNHLSDAKLKPLNLHPGGHRSSYAWFYLRSPDEVHYPHCRGYVRIHKRQYIFRF